jgi:hypothetical protein
MRLIVTWTSTDGDTCSNDHVQPIEYESEDAFLSDFEQKLTEVLKADEGEFIFAGIRWDVYGFFFVEEMIRPKSKEIKQRRIISLPQVRTLDKWFADESAPEKRK